MNVYVVMIIEARAYCRVFQHEAAAVSFAKAAAQFNAVSAGLVLEENHIEGWLYHGHYGMGPNHGCVHVVERPVHEEL